MRRPDIAQAERSMASEHALIGAAYASFFPSFSLTAALGFSSPDISQFLKWIGRYWMLGADMSQMVFDGGRDCADLKIAIARFRQASGSYQQQVLTAFQEVEDALTNIAQYTKQADNLQEVVRASKKATAISMNRYVNGVSIYLEVMENERLELQAEVNWINVLNLRYAATVQLIKALGGGWGDPQGCVLQ
jgi:multidrug efflux system outer membrane protein